MTLLQVLLHSTSLRSPLLRTLVPTAGAAFAIQTAFAVPSIAYQTDRFYDASGALTFLSCTLLSLYLPVLRARQAAALEGATLKLPSLLSPILGSGSGGGVGAGVFNWRQVALSAAVVFWSVRLGTYLFRRVLAQGSDSRFDEIKKSYAQFSGAWFGQATWVTTCLLPVIAINSLPAATFAALPSAAVALTDVLGVALWAGGFAFEVTADRQKGKWLEEKRQKAHDEQFLTRGLWSRSQFPNYFGEVTLWTGVATAASGVLLTKPGQVGLGLSGGLSTRALAVAMCYASPAFVALLLLKVSGVPMSEKKYDKRYGDRKDYQEWKQNTPKFFPKLS